MTGAERRASRPALLRWSKIERELRRSGTSLIAGVDEVGRGSLAGPVLACAIIMPPNERAIRGVDDSKRLTPRQRARLAVKIRAKALAMGLGAASAREIDRLNIYHATVLAMRRALSRLTLTPEHILIDGRQIRTLRVAHTAIVGGDARCFCIACASIIAKVTRDRLMRSLAVRHPGYGWDHNVGYGTLEHWNCLRAIGPVAHHRVTFTSPRQFSLDLDFSPPLVVDETAADADVLDAVAM